MSHIFPYLAKDNLLELEVPEGVFLKAILLLCS